MDGDGWVDSSGMFLAAVGAGPVYQLLGKSGLPTSEFPPMGTGLIGGDVAFRQHSGGHTPAPNRPTFITFASRYFPSEREHFYDRGLDMRTRAKQLSNRMLKHFAGRPEAAALRKLIYQYYGETLPQRLELEKRRKSRPLTEANLRRLAANFAKGRQWEARCANFLAKEGYLVIRSKQSKGPFDMVRLPVDGQGDVRAVQVKTTVERFRKDERERLARWADKLPSFVRIELWLWPNVFDRRYRAPFTPVVEVLRHS